MASEQQSTPREASERYAYIGREKCGHVTRAVVDDPAHQSATEPTTAPQQWRREAHRDDRDTEADRHERDMERYSLPGSHVCRYETVREWRDGVERTRDVCLNCDSPAPTIEILPPRHIDPVQRELMARDQERRAR